MPFRYPQTISQSPVWASFTPDNPFMPNRPVFDTSPPSVDVPTCTLPVSWRTIPDAVFTTAPRTLSTPSERWCHPNLTTSPASRAKNLWRQSSLRTRRTRDWRSHRPKWTRSKSHDLPASSAIATRDLTKPAAIHACCSPNGYRHGNRENRNDNCNNAFPFHLNLLSSYLEITFAGI